MKTAPTKKGRAAKRAHPRKPQPPLLEISNLRKSGGGNIVVNDTTFSVIKLEKIAVAGETGAGKSSLLKLIAGFLQPDGGVLMYEGRKVLGPDDHLVPGHPGIAYLSQHFELQKFLRVEQVLEYSNMLSDAEAHRLYRICQIGHLLKRGTDQLSGGEKQRVAICRLLISRPGLLLLDEPFSHLDMVHKNTLKSVIRDIGEKLSITCMLVSHDPADTLPWADRILVMRDGAVVQLDTPSQIYHTPVDEYTAGLFGKCNWIEQKEMRLFAKLRAMKRIKASGHTGKVLIRPEQFTVVRKSERALRARVDQVAFYGSYWEAEVYVSKKRITIRTSSPDLKPGDIVYLSLGNEELWKV